jgi:ABC-2 type transport system ATP-binding protein
MVMDHGVIVADDSPDALKARISGDVVTIGLADEHDRAELVVRDAVAAREVVVSDTALLVTVDEGAVAVAPILRALDTAGLHATSITVNRPTLDDVFLTLTGRSLREDTEAA